MTTKQCKSVATAVSDSAHADDIRGAFGTIAHHDVHPRRTFGQRLKTLMAILGPGLIVMVGDNDAGAFGTYSQAGQNYGTTLLWTLFLLIPVLYINQEMVLRLGAVTRVGHARLIFERFGKFWGTFSVIDLFLLNALTIITEFIGISLGLEYLGLDRVWGIVIAAAITIGAASTGDFRRFERFALSLVLGSLLLVPVFLIIHPPLSQVAHDFLVPKMPTGSKLNEVMLLIIAIVGTTVAPWQLFFQQSYVVDKRITPRFIRYERLDLAIGIGIVILGSVAIMAATTETFANHPEFGHFVDTGAVAAGMEKYFGRSAGVLFALALIDACIIGASAVSLASAYALGDILSIHHSLHRKPAEAKVFYAFYVGLIALGAALVIIPGVPLGQLTNLVQTLAGVLLPGATVFLMLLCNDKAVLGPWVNSRRGNLFTAAIITGLVLLSIILTSSVIFPDITDKQILSVLIGGSTLGLFAMFAKKVYERTHGIGPHVEEPVDEFLRETWLMPPIHQLAPAKVNFLNWVWLAVLRIYLVLAGGLLFYKIVRLAISGGTV
jgi:Mn2+/Fe2+ NRAMP family transporter